MFRLLLEPVPPLESLSAEVPAEVVATVSRALSKDKTERFDTALEMAAALRLSTSRCTGCLAN
jgi:hypothetical protein